ASPAHAGSYAQGPRLYGNDAVGNATQGNSVALSADGSTAIVGANEDNGGAGAAFVYLRTGGIWKQQGPKLVGLSAGGPARQSNAVALSADGNTAIVGGFNDTSGAGASWVFTRTAGVWS